MRNDLERRLGLLTKNVGKYRSSGNESVILSYPAGRNSSIGRDLLPEGKVGTYDRDSCSRRTFASARRGSISCESCKLCRFQIAPWMTPMGCSPRRAHCASSTASPFPSPPSRARLLLCHSVVPQSFCLPILPFLVPSLDSHSFSLPMIPFDGCELRR